MNFKLFLAISLILLSCKNKDKFNYETSIASKVYQAQLKYLDNTLFNYARISKQGDYYFQESYNLDTIADNFKNEIKNGIIISNEEKSKFYDHFEKTFTNHGLIDLDILKQLRELPIKTVSDVDLLRLYVKNNFVRILLNNKLLPYDSWGMMAETEKLTINNGEAFEVSLSNTAWNSAQPNEWFLVKNGTDSLTKDNIIDTLYQQESGIVFFTTKKI